MTKTLNIRGHKLRSASQRRFLVVGVTYTGEFGHRETKSVFIHKRSDCINTARTIRRRLGFPNGCFYLVVDSLTGEEISG